MNIGKFYLRQVGLWSNALHVSDWFCSILPAVMLG